MLKKTAEDALHKAIEAINRMNYLITWNCKQTAYAQMRSAIESVIRQCGCQPQIICSSAKLPEIKRMWTDPIVEEIHKIRQEHAAKFDYDLRAIVRDYQKRQRLSGKKVISFISNNDDEVPRIERYEKQKLVEV